MPLETGVCAFGVFCNHSCELIDPSSGTESCNSRCSDSSVRRLARLYTLCRRELLAAGKLCSETLESFEDPSRDVRAGVV